MKNLIVNIQHYSLHDGPGIRTVVFLKGYPLRCRWCCNPESQEYVPQISYLRGNCLGQKACGICQKIYGQEGITFDAEGKAVLHHEICDTRAKECACCPSQAMKLEGKQYTVKKILDLVERDEVFYGQGEGGLTVSGGEPLTHKDFLIDLLSQAQKRRIHTAIETCGYAPYENLAAAAEYLDYVLYDIKSMDEAKSLLYTGKSNAVILENFTRLCSDCPKLPKKVRTPVIPGFNDSLEEIQKIIDFLKQFENVTYEPLKYHNFGQGKYKALGRKYELEGAKLAEGLFEKIEELAKTAFPPLV